MFFCFYRSRCVSQVVDLTHSKIIKLSVKLTETHQNLNQNKAVRDDETQAPLSIPSDRLLMNENNIKQSQSP